jgi:hypothetical protein
VTDTFTTPDDGGDLRSSDFTTSMSDRLGAQWADTLDPKDSLSGMWIARQARQAAAGGEDIGVGAGGDVDVFSGQSLGERQAAADARVNAIPDISQSDAKDLLKQEGLTEQDVHLGDAPTHKLPVLKMQIEEAHTRRDRAAAIARGPQGFFPDALGAVTSIGVGMIDPVNAAAFSIPVIGEARMGKIIASAGDSIFVRGAARFGEGAAQGAVGTAALQPADWWLHTRDGQDYTMANAMESVIMGAGMGGAFHALHGGLTDYLARRQGLPLPGSPQDLLLRGLMTGTHVPATALADEGVPIEEVPGIGPVVAPRNEAAPIETPHPAEVLADLPSPVRQDAVHAAMADIISGRPTQGAEMLEIAADHDPRIAESFEAFHGSPHDVDRFDSSRIGTGEGAQTYGHGLYFAENEKVAAKYARSTSGQDFIRKAQELYDEHDMPDDAHAAIAESKDFTPGQKRLLLALEKDGWLGFDYPHQAVSAALSDPNGKKWEMSPETLDAIKHVGNMYRVRINAHQDHFLDWDRPVSEQSDHVRSKLRAAGFKDEQTGRDVYHALVKYRPGEGGGTSSAGMKMSDLEATPEAASGQLSATGIHGIKYRDQNSRDGVVAQVERDLRSIRNDPESTPEMIAHGERRLEDVKRQFSETRNYVVFDDKHIEITHKNGEPVKREDLVAEHNAQHAAKKAPRGRAAADPQTWSLFEYLASRGGLKPDADLLSTFGNSRGPFVPGFGPLLRKGGMTMDDALIAAKEGGYFLDPTSQEHVQMRNADMAALQQSPTFGVRDLMEKIDEESRGRKQYREGHLPEKRADADEEALHIVNALHDELEATSGQKGIHVDPEIERRVVEIIQKESEHDVLAAYDRAIMEDEERYNAVTESRQADQHDHFIPGWDVPEDAGAASPRGGTLAAAGGEAGRAGSGSRGNAGEQPRTAGQGDRATGQAQLTRSSPAVAAADPRWRELADTTPDYNEPEVLAESEAAAKLPEPDSIQPAKSLSALERAAADAEEVWRQLEPTLTEEERALVNNVMDQLKLDAEARSRIITDGVTCLAGAIG